MSRVPTSLSEKQAASVLERASQLEANRGGDVDVAELRRAALDAGIPLPAFERALAEVVSSGEPPPVSVPASSSNDWIGRLGLRGWSRKAFLGVLGTAVAGFGFAFGSMATDELIPLTIFWAFLVLCGLVVSRRRDRSIIGFESDLLALCAGLTLGWTIGNPVDAAQIVVAMSFVGTATALVGGLLVALARPQPPALPEHSPPIMLGETGEAPAR